MCPRMCSPSSTNHQSRSSANKVNILFDTKQKTLCQDHKFTTADLSQVCDGRNWELLREAQAAAEAKKITNAAKTRSRNHVSKSKKKVSNDDSAAAADVKKEKSRDAADKVKSRVLSSYMPKSARPISSCNGEGVDSSSRSLEQQEAKQQRDTLPVKQLQQQDKTPSEDIKTKIGEGAPAPSKTAEQQVKGQQKSEEPSQSSRRRSSNSSPQGRISESKSSDDKSRRRHSNEGKVSSGNSKSGKPRRRLSVDSNTTSSSSMESGSRVTVRKLSEPMHRCSTTNQNVSGIMRRARYSSNNLAAMDKSSNTSPRSSSYDGLSDSQRRRRASMGTAPSPGLTARKFDQGLFGLSSEIGSSAAVKPSRSSSAENFNRFYRSNSNLQHYDKSNMQEMSNERWVASGVNFSQSMEVYLFKT